MGQAKRRAGKINVLKAGLSPIDSQKAAAIHEAAHVIAAVHFGVSLGEEGVSLEELKEYRNGRLRVDYGGYAATQWQGLNAAISDERWSECAASAMIGPLAELRYRLSVSKDVPPEALVNRVLKSGHRDFESCLSKTTPEEVVEDLARLCLAPLIGQPYKPITSNPASEYASAWTALAKSLLDNFYDSAIRRFADYLLSAPNFRLSSSEAESFAKQQLKAVTS